MRRPDPQLHARPTRPPVLDIGSDIALAHAVGREIIRTGLADHDFIERATSGFEEYGQLVEPWTPSLAAKVTGVPASAVRQLAQSYARQDRAPGSTEQHEGDGTEHARALANLSLLTGHLSVGGGRRAAFALVRHDPPVDLTDERYPIRLTTGRRLTATARGGGATPPRNRSESIELCPEDAERYGVAVGEQVRVSSRQGSVVAPVWVDTELRPGLAFMAATHVPDEVDTGLLTAGANCPIAGTAEFTASAIRIERLPARTGRPADEGVERAAP